MAEVRTVHPMSVNDPNAFHAQAPIERGRAPSDIPPAPSHRSRQDSSGPLSVVLNIIWLVLAGFWLFLTYLIAAVVMFITIIGIPFGLQSLKLAVFALWPFGRVVVHRPGTSNTLSVIGNVLWFLLAGWYLALAHLVTGIVLCITIIGIPLGIANFKLIPLALVPFGKDIARKGETAEQVAYSF